MITKRPAIKLTGRINYAIGTPLIDIIRFDRSTHVSFNCPKHPANHYSSKDPFVSSLFITNMVAMEPLESECDCPIAEHVTIAPYSGPIA